MVGGRCNANKIHIIANKRKIYKLNSRSDLFVTGMSYTQSASDNKRVLILILIFVYLPYSKGRWPPQCRPV